MDGFVQTSKIALRPPGQKIADAIAPLAASARTQVVGGPSRAPGQKAGRGGAAKANPNAKTAAAAAPVHQNAPRPAQQIAPNILHIDDDDEDDVGVIHNSPAKRPKLSETVYTTVR